jgi:hypothetical protein
MTRRVFVDTKWRPKKNRDSKMHVCYDPQNDTFFEVNSLIELKYYDEIYLDSSLFPNMWQQLRELVNNGKNVYYFCRPWKREEMRKERFRDELKAKVGKVSKDDKGDAFLLWKAYELSLIKNNTHRYFRLLTIVDVELRPLLMKEQMLYKNLQRIHRASIIGVDVGSDVKILKEMVEDARREIVDKAVQIIPRFIDIADSLGLNRDDISGLAGLTGELIYNRSMSYSSSVRFHGLYKAKGFDARKKKKHSSKAQRYLLMLTNTILCKNDEKHSPTFKDMRRVLRMVIEARKQMGLAGGRGWGLSPSKTHMYKHLVLGEPNGLKRGPRTFLLGG